MGFDHQIDRAFRLKFSLSSNSMIRSTGGLSPSAHRFTPRLRQRQRRRQQVACARGGSWRSDLVMGVEKDGVEWWFNGIRYYINGDLMVFNGDLMGFNGI